MVQQNTRLVILAFLFYPGLLTINHHCFISPFSQTLAPQFLPSATDPVMDLFTGDDFPGHVAPFPETSDLLYPEPTALIHPAEVITRGHGHNPPAQKLRPIRCNGRSSPVCPVVEPPENGWLVGTPLCCQNMASSDVDYLSNQLCVANSESSLDFRCDGNQGEATEVLKKKDCGDVAGNACVQMEDTVRPRSGDVAKFWDSKIIETFLEQDSSSSLNGDYDSSGGTKELDRGKRGKKTMKKLEDFVENLVMKVMEKQEQMHKQLVDIIEKKEKERVMREEAWKQKEMERIERDEEARAQEKSCNLALISFIQNLLGNEIQIPQPVSIFREDVAEESIQKDLKRDPSSNRWPEAEVQALITLRTSLEGKFRLMGFKCSIWEEISEAMSNMDYNRSAKKCKEKWENINKYYKRTMGSGKKRRLNGKACPYFDELDILYRNGLLNPGNALSNNANNVAKIEKE